MEIWKHNTSKQSKPRCFGYEQNIELFGPINTLINKNFLFLFLYSTTAAWGTPGTGPQQRGKVSAILCETPDKKAAQGVFYEQEI